MFSSGQVIMSAIISQPSYRENLIKIYEDLKILRVKGRSVKKFQYSDITRTAQYTIVTLLFWFMVFHFCLPLSYSSLRHHYNKMSDSNVNKYRVL